MGTGRPVGKLLQKLDVLYLHNLHKCNRVDVAYRHNLFKRVVFINTPVFEDISVIIHLGEGDEDWGVAASFKSEVHQAKSPRPHAPPPPQT